MTGTLYLCATPIGNLEDMTLRAIRVLGEVDLIAAEDTRNSIKLLNHFQISTPMTSYHEYNKYDKGRALVDMLLEGKNIALITDAGTPAISDPGEELVKMAYDSGICVTSLPGCCACTTALTLSGMSTRRFCFEAFLPSDKKDRQAVLKTLATETRTIILYEAPHHLLKTLKELLDTLGDRPVSICRELTKLHETVYRAVLSQALEYYSQNAPKGECVIVIEGLSHKEQLNAEQEKWRELSVSEHVGMYLEEGLDKKTAMKQAAVDRGISKRDVYSALLAQDEN